MNKESQEHIYIQDNEKALVAQKPCLLDNVPTWSQQTESLKEGININANSAARQLLASICLARDDDRCPREPSTTLQIPLPATLACQGVGCAMR